MRPSGGARGPQQRWRTGGLHWALPWIYTNPIAFPGADESEVWNNGALQNSEEP